MDAGWIFFFHISPSVCFSTGEKLVNVWNYSFCFPLHFHHLVSFSRTKILELLIYVYFFLFVAVEFEHLFVGCIILFHCELTLKTFLMEAERKGEEKFSLHPLVWLAFFKFCKDLRFLVTAIMLNLIEVKHVSRGKSYSGLDKEMCFRDYINVTGDFWAKKPVKILTQSVCSNITMITDLCTHSKSEKTEFVSKALLHSVTSI